ncbi:MAG: hypothetical protein M3N34_00070 [Pseudomonadota bacterium]|nr:hypothetical protein [Pseudomonadota bacterium]
MADLEEDPARLGFMILQFMRLSGVAFALFGAAILAGKIHLPAFIGGGLAVFGVVESLLLPALLARRWKSRER